MSPVASVLVAAGGVLAVLASIGLLKFRTPFARFHAAGKASPIAFLLVAAGATVELGVAGAPLAVAAAALLLTLPLSTHLLFRATHRTTAADHLCSDALRDAVPSSIRPVADVAPPGPAAHPATPAPTAPTAPPAPRPSPNEEDRP